MRIQVLQHVPFEGPAHIGLWAAAHGHPLTTTHLYQEQPLPLLSAVDGVVVMGGPMSIHDEAEFAWLRQEKQWLEAVIAAGKPVLGICLGAQMLAQVLGGRVSKNRDKEIGWWPIHAVDVSAEVPLAAWMPERVEVFHWHGETFDLPPGSRHLAASAGCAQQAFLYEQRVLGLQFHLETTPESASLLLHHCGDELQAGGPYVQSVQEISGSPAQFARIHPLVEQVMAAMVLVQG